MPALNQMGSPSGALQRHQCLFLWLYKEFMCIIWQTAFSLIWKLEMFPNTPMQIMFCWCLNSVLRQDLMCTISTPTCLPPTSLLSLGRKLNYESREPTPPGLVDYQEPWIFKYLNFRWKFFAWITEIQFHSSLPNKNSKSFQPGEAFIFIHGVLNRPQALPITLLASHFSVFLFRFGLIFITVFWLTEIYVPAPCLC